MKNIFILLAVVTFFSCTKENQEYYTNPYNNTRFDVSMYSIPKGVVKVQVCTSEQTLQTYVKDENEELFIQETYNTGINLKFIVSDSAYVCLDINGVTDTIRNQRTIFLN